MNATGLFLDGRWVAGAGPELIHRNPADGTVAWQGRTADQAQVAAACAAARRALRDWSAQGFRDRVSILRRYEGALQARRDVLAEAISREVGKPRWEAQSEVNSIVAKIDLSIDAHMERCADFRGGAAIASFRPHGVIAVFGPFNFPGHLPNGHLVPALLAGNTVVLKPSERAPGVAALLVECLVEAGLPAGVINLVAGGAEVGQWLAAQEEIDGIFFTGSARTGLWLHRQFAGRPDKILALEMGGNNPLVAWSVSDFEAAAVLIAQSAYATAGQRCTCARRLIVPADFAGQNLIERVAEFARRLRSGTPAQQPEPFMGPVIGPEAAQSLLDAQARLVAGGAKPIVPLQHLEPGTGLVAPGLLDVTGVVDRPDEEFFGPLLQVIRVRDFEAALAEAGATRYGLAAGLLSDDPGLWHHFRATIRAGIVNWNQPLIGASSAAPFGGIGFSGNHRPGAYLAADYSSYAMASIESERVKMPAWLPPGLLPAVEP